MKTIALVIENSREYGRNMIRGIAAFGQLRRDWRLRLVTPAELVVTGALDGYSGVIARVADARILQCLKAANLPVVDVFAHFTQTDFIRVDTDHAKLGRRAADYFLSKGYTSFAYCGYDGTAYSDLRRDAFAARLAEAGHTPRQAQ